MMRFIKIILAPGPRGVQNFSLLRLIHHSGMWQPRSVSLGLPPSHAGPGRAGERAQAVSLGDAHLCGMCKSPGYCPEI